MGRLMKKLPSFRGALVLSSAMALAFAADAGTRSYSHISPDTQAEISIRTPGQSAVSRSVVLPFSKSTVVELPVGMKDVIISNPDIVEAMVHTDKRAVLIGKRPGQTNAYFYGHDGEEILNLEIRVERDISGLRELFAQHAPEANVQVQAVNDNLLLTLGESTVSLISNAALETGAGFTGSGVFNNSSGLISYQAVSSRF